MKPGDNVRYLREILVAPPPRSVSVANAFLFQSCPELSLTMKVGGGGVFFKFLLVSVKIFSSLFVWQREDDTLTREALGAFHWLLPPWV